MTGPSTLPGREVGRDTSPVIAVMGLPNVVSVTLVALVVAVVFRSRVLGANSRRSTHWVDAWLKAAVIVVFVVFFVVFLPSYVMQTGTVAKLDRNAQDVIGSGVFIVGFGATLVGLRLAYRANRV